MVLIRQAKPFRTLDHDQVQGQKESPADITQGPSEAGNPPDRGRSGNFVQERVIKTVAGRKPNVGQDQKYGGLPIITFSAEKKQPRKKPAQDPEERQELFL